MPDRVWYIKNLDLFEGLQDMSAMSVAGNAGEVLLDPKQIITFQGDQPRVVYVVISGRLQVSHLLPDGREVILTYLGPGDIWGAVDEDEVDAPASPMDSHQAMAQTPTQLLRFDAAYFRHMLSRRPRVAFKIIRQLGIRKRRVELRLINLCFKTNLQKLASLLLELAESHGVEIDGGIRIGLGLTHQEMGAMVGMTREQVTKLFTQLRESGAIETVKGRIILRDLDRLREIGGPRQGG
ncbi:Crp/Fnr family transcriptional regulator [bacterium]|nr:Crp/Fnr family transcriptional regulator [bacterium]